MGDQVVPVLVLLQSTESHLCARNVLLWVLKVLKQSFLVPLNRFLLVGVGVGETLDRSGVTSEKAVQIGTDLVALAFTESVALSASCLERC